MRRMPPQGGAMRKRGTAPTAWHKRDCARPRLPYHPKYFSQNKYPPPLPEPGSRISRFRPGCVALACWIYIGGLRSASHLHWEAPGCVAFANHHVPNPEASGGIPGSSPYGHPCTMLHFSWYAAPRLPFSWYAICIFLAPEGGVRFGCGPNWAIPTRLNSNP